MATPTPRKLNGLPAPIAPNAIMMIIVKKESTTTTTTTTMSVTIALMIMSTNAMTARRAPEVDITVAASLTIQSTPSTLLVLSAPMMPTTPSS